MKRLHIVAFITLALTLGAAPRAASYGQFIGDVVTRWLDDGRMMELTDDFAYIDPSGKKWPAPKGSKVDGASIPRVLWTPIGGPFEGQYRKASVLHDVACVLKKDPWQKVHRMFYDAMLCGGVGEKRALAMYAAVYKFGPRWSTPPSGLGGVLGGLLRLPRESPGPPPPPPPPPPEDLLQQMEMKIDQQGITTPEQAVAALGQ